MNCAALKTSMLNIFLIFLISLQVFWTLNVCAIVRACHVTNCPGLESESKQYRQRKCSNSAKATERCVLPDIINKLSLMLAFCVKLRVLPFVPQLLLHVALWRSAGAAGKAVSAAAVGADAAAAQSTAAAAEAAEAAEAAVPAAAQPPVPTAIPPPAVPAAPPTSVSAAAAYAGLWCLPNTRWGSEHDFSCISILCCYSIIIMPAEV